MGTKRIIIMLQVLSWRSNIIFVLDCLELVHKTITHNIMPSNKYAMWDTGDCYIFSDFTIITGKACQEILTENVLNNKIFCGVVAILLCFVCKHEHFVVGNIRSFTSFSQGQIQKSTLLYRNSGTYFTFKHTIF